MMFLVSGRGQFIDSFYLGVRGSLLAVNGEYAYVVNDDETGQLFLSKYRILDKIK
ncbi:MAG: hypothetical protein ACPLRX_10090 [Candidatus Saccharicenans sp.]